MPPPSPRPQDRDVASPVTICSQPDALLVFVSVWCIQTRLPLLASNAYTYDPAAKNIRPSCTRGVMREAASSSKGSETQLAPNRVTVARLISAACTYR